MPTGLTPPERSDRTQGFSWRAPLFAAIAACLVCLPMVVYGGGDPVGFLLYVLIVVALASFLALLVLIPFLSRRNALKLALRLAAIVLALSVLGLIFKIVPGIYQQNGDIIALALGGLTWAILAAATLHLTGSKLLTQLRSRIA